MPRDYFLLEVERETIWSCNVCLSTLLRFSWNKWCLFVATCSQPNFVLGFLRTTPFGLRNRQRVVWRRIEYHYFKRWLLIYEARVRPLLDATRKKILTRERFVAHRCCQGATRQGRRPRAQPLRRIDAAVFVDGSISCFLMSFPFVRTYKALRLV